MAHISSHTLRPNRGVAGAYIRVMDAVSGATAVLAAAALAAGVLAVCHMIFMRYALDQSTVWQTEFAVFSVTGAMLLGAPYVLMTGGHVAVTVLPDALSGWPRKLMLLAASLVGLGFCVALTYGAWLYVLEAWHGGWTTGSVWNPPLWPALLPMAIGASLLSLQYVAEILRGEANHGSSH
ncbi:TRAP transporter small permease [Halomonas sp. McH1-25]|uniref:TRAP transporter small permease n=1 Tax=unclassified Halomonas TaxID=2609666 RepID=UPI001EF5668D|nr:MULTISPECIES: TRAP transporter small permease [unclassified Halomonas]MCG7599814.1 TRAP transporter small permease [Halomonas sp. McH1-25]MCP1341709.1 TRAP transporter small permease [Halomonas sp. FL8]MCP1359867.1 TRAP transporter small permease [Halomonas sp. BBD45]MCP1367465.1 TRAP transporter small permease [Halomonas sp. BBD48]